MSLKVNLTLEGLQAKLQAKTFTSRAFTEVSRTIQYKTPYYLIRFFGRDAEAEDKYQRERVRDI
jgi:hypothetical protein